MKKIVKEQLIKMFNCKKNKFNIVAIYRHPESVLPFAEYKNKRVGIRTISLIHYCKLLKYAIPHAVSKFKKGDKILVTLHSNRPFETTVLKVDTVRTSSPSQLSKSKFMNRVWYYSLVYGRVVYFDDANYDHITKL